MFLITAFKWVSSFFSKNGLISYLADFIQRKADSNLERDKLQVDLALARLTALTSQTTLQVAYQTRAMDTKWFWIAWSIAAIPTSIWYGWGLLDSTINNGATLSDVSALPTQLYDFAVAVWDSLFFTGGGVAIASKVAQVIGDRQIGRAHV